MKMGRERRKKRKRYGFLREALRFLVFFEAGEREKDRKRYGFCFFFFLSGREFPLHGGLVKREREGSETFES